MIFPETKDKSNIIVKKAKGFVNFITGSSGFNHPRFKVPTPDKMRSMCLNIYFDGFKEVLLSGNFKENWDICKAAADFATLFQSCYCQYCGNAEFSPRDWIIPRIIDVCLLFVKISSVIMYVPTLQDTRNWLHTVTQELMAQKTLQFPQKMASAVVLMCYAHSVEKFNVIIAEEVSIVLLRVMALPDDAGYNYLRSLMKEEESLYVITALLLLCD